MSREHFYAVERAGRIATERDALAARVEELEARIARAVEVVGMAPSYSTRGRAISILLGEDSGDGQ